MARPKSNLPKADVAVVAVMGSPEYRDWLKGQVKRTHIPARSIVKIALTEWAAKNGVQPPPER